MTREPSYLIIARITRTQGLGGAVRIELVLEDDRYFEPGRRLLVGEKSGERRAEVEFFRRQHGRCVLKLRGTDSISDAEMLVGSEIRIPMSDLMPPADGAFYTFQLRGCRVYQNEEYIGTVTDVLDLGGTEILKVDGTADNETLIPFAQSFLKKIDLDSRRIDVDLPEGLREINK